MTRFETLNKADLALITKNQIAQQKSWRELPPEGVTAECSGQTFVVLPNVFPPRTDTRLLIGALNVEPGMSVLDMGTGCGALAIFAVLRGARRAMAVDINPDAVRNAALNVERHGLQDAIETRLSDGFAALAKPEQFDLIIANLPGRNEAASDAVEAAQWDTGFKTHRSFFAQAPNHLTSGGKVLMVKANYPELDDVVALAEQTGFGTRVLAKTEPEGDDPRTYYALGFNR